MNEQKRGRAKSAPQGLRNTWHGQSNVAGAPDFGIQQTSDQKIEAFRQKDIGSGLAKLKESVKRCSKHWNEKFKSAKKRKKEEDQQNVFIRHLNTLLSEFDEFKKALPQQVIELTRDDKQYHRDSTEASPSPFLLQRDPHEAAGGFEQFWRDPIEVKPAPLHQEDTGRFKQPKRDPNEDILKQFQQRLDVLERKLQDTESRCRRAEDKARTLAAEKEDLMTRLSQVAGSKLRDNNPAITDLSDPNRPIKLVEKISELYDNEWTDGMEALEKSGMKESDALKILLSVFTVSILRRLRFLCHHDQMVVIIVII
ncbi:hypothetical protein FSP39_015358 [Pinctada imbricata]|uniref:Uncharacterized protein n=1 Tax=Pinctada imbricata TaxID=66713 RepID=A0AA88Y7Z0_PINIB|nr:hypothetical protein FSP39_015358 [Pinctada imbricata]